MNGLLVVDKPKGKSSHDVVYRVRHITGEKRVGHAGTLDPMATGVLVICIGQATRLSEYLIDHDKTYRARVQLGVETDTYDATGQITGRHRVDVDDAQIAEALSSFVGKIQQRPPAHSAIQVDGVRAYKLARQGQVIELQARPVEFYSIQLRQIDSDQVEFDVHCSKGTFVRSLAHDLGERLGTGAHLCALTRLASGPFSLAESITLDWLELATRQGQIDSHVLPMDRGLEHFDAVNLDAAGAVAVRQGRFVKPPHKTGTPLVRGYDADGRFMAILETMSSGELKPKKVFDIPGTVRVISPHD